MSNQGALATNSIRTEFIEIYTQCITGESKIKSGRKVMVYYITAINTNVMALQLLLFNRKAML